MCRVPLHVFRVVQPQRTSSNLRDPQQCRASKVCRGQSQEFAVVRLYRTLSKHTVTRGSWCVGYLDTCSGWFNRSDLPRTIANHCSAEKTQCVEVSDRSAGDSTVPHHIFTRGSRCAGVHHVSSEGCASTEPYLTASSQEEHGVEGTCTSEVATRVMYGAPNETKSHFACSPFLLRTPQTPI